MDHEPQDRLRPVSDTSRKAEEGETANGWKRPGAIIDAEKASRTRRSRLNVAMTVFDLTEVSNDARHPSPR